MDKSAGGRRVARGLENCHPSARLSKFENLHSLSSFCTAAAEFWTPRWLKDTKCLGIMNRFFHNLHLLSLPMPALLQQAAAHIRLLFQYVATCSFVQHFFSSFFASEFALHLQHPRQISVTCLKNPYCVCKISTTGMIWRLVTKAAPSCQNCTKA